jgi:hypothetical protein
MGPEQQKGAVLAILPTDAALYLRSRGWQQRSAQPGRSSLWSLTRGDEEFEALLPMDVELRDYALRMGELLHVLAAAEGRSQEEVYADLLTSTSDVVRIRLIDPDLSDGMLPIEEHAQIAQRARDLVLAAACAATERRAVWHARKPAQALEYVRHVRIGPSERGSYVLTVNSRVTPMLQSSGDHPFEAEVPYERRVMQTLAQSLFALSRAAEEAALTQEMAEFDRAIPQGVSADLCDAVAGLWGADEAQRGLEFSFSWSPARAVPADAVRRVAFSPDRRALILAAARQMREREPVVDFELRGPVVKLERAEGASTGKVTVIGWIEGRQARVTVELLEGPYAVALEAHRQGQTIRTAGTLQREGRGLVLKKPGAVVIEEELVAS